MQPEEDNKQECNKPLTKRYLELLSMYEGVKTDDRYIAPSHVALRSLLGTSAVVQSDSQLLHLLIRLGMDMHA